MTSFGFYQVLQNSCSNCNSNNMSFLLKERQLLLSFLFSIGCPLGNILGVDPLGQYPWEKLCDYPSLKNEPACILYTQTSSQKYLGTRSRPQLQSSNLWPIPNVESTENYPNMRHFTDSIKQNGKR